MLCAGCGNTFEPRNSRQIRCRHDCGRTSHNQARDKRRSSNETSFVGIDGEGCGEGNQHRYVLLGIGSDQISNADGLTHKDVFPFLWENFEAYPTAAYVGYYLGYDFTHWVRSIPRDRAWYLYSKEGRAKRRRVSRVRLDPFPVEYEGWQFDLLGDKRFKLRPKGAKHWLWICDAGPFFQCSFLKAIDPAGWPEPVCTEAEYAQVERGKSHRSSAVLDSDMRRYNALENDILARLMVRLDTGFRSIGINLRRNQWYGPGQAAQEWLNIIGSNNAA
jgi:hypothetical protein